MVPLLQEVKNQHPDEERKRNLPHLVEVLDLRRDLDPAEEGLEEVLARTRKKAGPKRARGVASVARRRSLESLNGIKISWLR